MQSVFISVHTSSHDPYTVTQPTLAGSDEVSTKKIIPQKRVATNLSHPYFLYSGHLCSRDSNFKLRLIALSLHFEKQEEKKKMETQNALHDVSAPPLSPTSLFFPGVECPDWCRNRGAGEVLDSRCKFTRGTISTEGHENSVVWTIVHIVPSLLLICAWQSRIFTQFNSYHAPLLAR